MRINNGEWFAWSSGFQHGVWAWNEVTRDAIPLPDGITVIDITFREEGTILDKLYLSLDGRQPVDFGEEAINCASALNKAPIAKANLRPAYGSAPLTVNPRR